jgi:two-component system response regulator (stage 0 sporulation protein F)
MSERKILIVDDDSDIVKIITAMLEGKNWKTFTALSGEEALKLVSSKRPDVVLLDIMMPKMSGIEVLKKIKEIEPEVRIIMITAFGDVESYLDSMELGAFEYINKPFGTKELLQMIEKVAAA